VNWNEINLLLFIISFALGCMTLVLAVLFHLRTEFEWTKYYLVFQISITVLLVVQTVLDYVPVTGARHSPAELVILWLIICDIAFLIYFIPYFSTWIIAHPWRNPYKTIFLLLSIIFVALAVLGTIFGFPPWTKLSMALEFLGVILFTLAVLLKNIRDIADRDVRLLSLACMALSVFMAPFIIADMALSFQQLATMPIYYFWFSGIIFVYLFNYFRALPGRNVQVDSQPRFEKFHLTEREQEVVRLIGGGMSSKEIAGELSISVSTVNNHIANIYAKTHVSSRIDLVNLLLR
jgi:DNA-binding CsgD family transcriptional regulator